MKTKDENLKSSGITSLSKKEKLSPENGSHGVTLTQPRTEKGESKRNSDISTCFHLTVRIRNSSLTRKHFRLMLDTLIYEIVTEGINLYQYLMLEHLMSLLLGSKLSPLELSNEHERRVTFLAQILMRDLKGLSFYPESNSVVVLSKETSETIINGQLIMSERTYKSRKNYWKVEKFLEIRSVSVDTIIDRSGNSNRYSSYCKGYGESHPSAHNQKTKPSFELDGDDPRDPIDFSLKEIQSLLLLTQLEVKTKYKSRKA